MKRFLFLCSPEDEEDGTYMYKMLVTEIRTNELTIHFIIVG